ncbi:MAG: MarR family transcriptional regulator [Phycisphaerae bacterium]|nr:MarR family transcriptional regulator [Phycisphaerae bacterium]
MKSQTEFLKSVENWAKLYFFQSLTDFFNYLKHTELSLLQAYALTYLFFKGPVKISELCDHMMVSPGAASQLVDRLEKLELVERIADPKDRRVRKVIVLDKGERFVQENFAFSQSWLSEIPANISPQEEAQITAVLSILMQSSGKQNQPHFEV